jgi:hypothetical protein
MQLPAGGPDTVEIDATLGETMQGTLLGGQTLRAVTDAKADHIYGVSASLAPISAGAEAPGEVIGTVSGFALTGPVEFPVAVSAGGTAAQELTRIFLAQADGEMTVEFTFPSADVGESTGPALQTLRELIRGPTRAAYELLLVDLGLDDNGTSPQGPTTLPVGLEGERVGSIIPGDEADYFIFELLADLTYELKLESTDAVEVTSGSADRFGQVNFGVATAGGLTISVNASAGIPGIMQFTAVAAEEVLLRLTAPEAAGTTDGLSAPTIQYAISVVQVIPEGE